MDFLKFFQVLVLGCIHLMSVCESIPKPGEGISLMDFLMASSAKNVQRIPFGPDDGMRYRESYERKYGPRGRDLVAMLGQGNVSVGSSGFFSFGKDKDKIKYKRNSQKAAATEVSSIEKPSNKTV